MALQYLSQTFLEKVILVKPANIIKVLFRMMEKFTNAVEGILQMIYKREYCCLMGKLNGRNKS